MSGQPPGSAGNPASRSAMNGNGISMTPQQRSGEIGSSSTSSGQNGALSQQNLNGIVCLLAIHIFFSFSFLKICDCSHDS